MATVGLCIDIAIVVAVLVFALIGLKKGFLKSVLSLFSWVICVIVAVYLAKYVANLINKIYDFSSLIAGKINAGLTEEFYGTAINTFADSNDLIQQIPSGTNGIFKQLIKVVFSNANVDYELETKTVGDILSTQLGNICMFIISGVLVFALLKIILAILNHFIEKITKGRVIGKVDHILGLAFGTAKAVLIVLVFNFVLVALTLVPAVNKTITPLITENTTVEKFVYQQTDKIFEHYIVDGQLVQKLITDLWNAR